jgi:hypothetical protein
MTPFQQGRIAAAIHGNSGRNPDDLNPYYKDFWDPYNQFCRDRPYRHPTDWRDVPGLKEKYAKTSQWQAGFGEGLHFLNSLLGKNY